MENCNYEEMLGRYYTTGDVSIRNQVIENCLGLVYKIATNFYSKMPRCVEYEDIVSYGVFGLIKAAELFNHKKNCKFFTYAYQKIYGSILDELRKLDWVPRSKREQIKKAAHLVKQLENAMGCHVDYNEIAKYYNLTTMDINVMNGTCLVSFDELDDTIGEI